MRTLERKKSSASRLSANGRLNHAAAGQNGHNGASAAAAGEKNEFDDLISALRTGDVFGENMDKFRRNRKSHGGGHHGFRGSPPRVDRAESFLRERTREK